ncbi:peptidylprolyl isomerase [Paenibacillus donghaensis]|nr:peptidyl-prolyl cis-trans isomerase [Paenibacillus donghaensis]
MRNAVVILAVAAVVLGGLLIWSLHAVIVLKEHEAEQEPQDVATAAGQPISEHQWVDELKKKNGEEVLLGMINHIVVGKEATLLAIHISEHDIDQELKRIISGYGSEEQYYVEMRHELGLTREEVRVETLYRMTLRAIATAGITISEAEIDQYLEQNAERLTPRKQLQLSMITVASYEEAQLVMDQLEQGEDFAELAKELSTDQESGRRGGSLGLVEEGDPFWPEELLDTAAGLEPGDIAGPLEKDEEFAVIRLEEMFTPEAPDPAEVRALVRQELALEQAAPLQQVESDLRAKYDVSIDIDNRR